MDFRQLFSPAADRNAEPIARVLAPLLPENGMVLEVASGSGQHACYLARRYPRLVWQPTDPDPEALDSIAAYRESNQLQNLRVPLALNAAADQWPVDRADAVLAINLIHISPWETTLGLFSGARRLLSAHSPLILYGPYFVEGKASAASNVDFDRSLRLSNAAWGVRKLADVGEVAKREGFTLESVTEMPANNLIVVFRATGPLS